MKHRPYFPINNFILACRFERTINPCWQKGKEMGREELILETRIYLDDTLSDLIAMCKIKGEQWPLRLHLMGLEIYRMFSKGTI
jgi:hypothetical protein